MAFLGCFFVFKHIETSRNEWLLLCPCFVMNDSTIMYSCLCSYHNRTRKLIPSSHLLTGSRVFSSYINLEIFNISHSIARRTLHLLYLVHIYWEGSSPPMLTQRGIFNVSHSIARRTLHLRIDERGMVGHLFVFANAKHSCPLTVNCREDPRHLGHFELTLAMAAKADERSASLSLLVLVVYHPQPIGNATLT